MNPLNLSIIQTPLGEMSAIADETTLYRLDFVDVLNEIKKKHFFSLEQNKTPPLISIEEELSAFFGGNLTTFKTPITLEGTKFQQDAWRALLAIPYGETKSYKEQAEFIGKPDAFRAVANANGANKLSLIIPCHRIISHDGKLGGYGSGLYRKKWLLNHERKHSK